MHIFKSVASQLFLPQSSNNHRPRVLRATSYFYFSGLMLLFVVGLQLLSAFGGSYGAVLGFASSITPAQIIEQTNSQREKVGLPPLVVNTALSQAAQSKGQHMMTNQYWAHVAPDGTDPWYFIRQSGYQYRVAGENLARDFDETSRMVSAWMDSPTHRANILNNRYTEIGIAVIDGNLEGYETTLVVQMFGQPTTLAASGDNPTVGINQQQAKQEVPQPAVLATDTDPTTNLESELDTNPNPASDLTENTIPEAIPDSISVTPTSNSIFGPSPIPAVLASALVPMGSIEIPPLLTPIQLTKAVFLSLIMMLGTTLAYDAWIAENNRTVRIVGKNLAHIFFFSAVAFLVIFFRAGLIG